MNSPNKFNTIIVGGGIVGAGIFRDLSLHNIETLIIDKNDFTSRTSQSSSKMLHGGIRYLENMDFALIHEALHEKNLWLKIAPHLCYEERFYLPVFQDSKRPLWMIKIGLFLYDLLSGFQNTTHELKNKSNTLAKFPFLKSSNLSGAGIYSDAIVDDAKMTLEMIYDGLKNSKCQALNYSEFIKSEKINEQSHRVYFKNTISNKEIVVECKNLVFATGPYTDTILKRNYHAHWQNIILPSKGSHLWFPKEIIPISNPIVITTNDNRVIFVIPQNEMVLVGTTEVKINPPFDEVQIEKHEIEYLIHELNNYFPKLNISEKDIIGSYAGVRPLVKEDDNESLGKTSREHKIIQIQNNVFCIAGGKYTTFRVMGQDISRIIVSQLGHSYNDQLTTMPIRQKSTILPFQFHCPTDAELISILENELPKNFEDLVIRRIGINSKKIWNYKSKIDFDSYFLSKMELINRYFPMTSEDLKTIRDS
jgi:glycerol-3-phosphate dehydrogenase